MSEQRSAAEIAGDIFVKVGGFNYISREALQPAIAAAIEAERSRARAADYPLDASCMDVADILVDEYAPNWCPDLAKPEARENRNELKRRIGNVLSFQREQLKKEALADVAELVEYRKRLRWVLDQLSPSMFPDHGLHALQQIAQAMRKDGAYNQANNGIAAIDAAIAKHSEAEKV
jgi:hypothetical protein